jgi:hypothetical protein
MESVPCTGLIRQGIDAILEAIDQPTSEHGRDFGGHSPARCELGLIEYT